MAAYTRSIKASSDWKEALHRFQQLRQTWQPDVIAYGTAIATCKWQHSHQLLRSLSLCLLRANLVIFNAALDCQWHLALWQGLRQCGLKGDVVTYGALCNRNEWQQSLQILEEVHMFNIQSDSITWGGCISGLREWHRSLVFLQRMATQGFERDLVSFCAAISACSGSTQWEDSLRLLDTGMTAGSASAAMVGCEGARWTKAIEILNKVHKPNAVVFGSAMSACQRSQQRHAVAELLKDFVQRSLEQTQVMSSVAIAISTWRKALWLLRGGGDLVTYSTAMTRCISYQWQWTLHLATVKDVKGNLVTKVLELKALAVGGQLLPLLVEAEALSLRLLARDAFGQRHGTSWWR